MATKLQVTQSSARVAPAGDTAWQFVIERICPSEGTPDPDVMRDVALPFAVWVNAQPMESQSCDCGGRNFMVTDDAIDNLRIKHKLGLGCCICENTGHFIE